MNIRNLSVRTRLTLLILIPNFMLLATVGYGLHAVRESVQRQANGQKMDKTVRLAIDSSRKAQVQFKAQVQEWKNLIVRGGDPEDFQAYRNAFLKASGQVQEDLNTLTALMGDMGMATGAVMKTIADHAALEPRYAEAIEQYDAKNPQRAQIADRALRGIDRETTQGIDELVKAVRERGQALDEELAAQNAAKRKEIIIMLFAFLSVALITSIVSGILIARSIIRPLKAATAVAEQVARGDLTAEIVVTSKDETGRLLQSLKTMNMSLGSIVSEVRSSSESVSAASEQMATGNAELSSRTEQQASSLEETAASMEELASTVRQNAENARQATGYAVSASELASKGGEVVGRVVKTMDQIQASSKKISEIIGVIDGIAFQTNILALNASVEAARAGEQGRGFAVVASEVRNLAQRSATAAKEIKGLIADSVHSVDAGSELVDEAGRTITDVVASVKKVSDAIGEIATATGEQSTGISQVNEAVTELDRVTQQNAQLVDDSANASESARQQAIRLAAAVAVFKLDQGAVSPAVRPAAVPAKAALVALAAPKADQPRQTVRPRNVAGASILEAAHAKTEGEWSSF
jgi:methyl-accepting chemotaxis protein